MYDLRVGISSCLLGNRVRYDGRDKHLKELAVALPRRVELIAFCPEVATGMGVPRPPIYLSDSLAYPEARQADNPEKCFTKQLREFAWRIALEHDLHGFIFKARSPSCGLGSTPVIINGQVQERTVSGVFAAALLEQLPGLPVIDETRIGSEPFRNRFLDQCYMYRKFGLAGC